jgi:hypothetical protein
MPVQSHHTEYHFDDKRRCFHGGTDLDIPKNNGNSHEVLIHNRDSQEDLDFAWVVCWATVNGRPVDPTAVLPFIEDNRQGRARPNDASVYHVKPHIFWPGARVHVYGAFFPLRSCHSHTPCRPRLTAEELHRMESSQDRGILVHTDWHIEC